MTDPGASPEKRFAPFRADPARTGIFTDFDGTLSEVVEQPDAAAPLPGAVATVVALAERYERVAVISGRPLAFLRRTFGDQIILSGLYGIEGLRDGEPTTLPAAVPWRPVVAEVAERAAHDLGDGIIVESKELALTLHYRLQPERRGEVEDWAARAAADTGLEVAASRQSVELNPPLRVDKGVVLAELAGGLDQVCFVGDDRGDIPAFDALRTLRLRGVTTVSVAVRGPETAPEVLAAADLAVDGPTGAVALLRSLL